MKTVEVTYYKIKNIIKFSDGFEIKPDAKVIFISKDENDLYNVMQDDGQTKRIFWVEESNLKSKKTQKERWSKSKLAQYDIDINENWLEHEQRTAKQAKVRAKPNRNNEGKKENNSPTSRTGKTRPGTAKKSSRDIRAGAQKSKTQVRKTTKSAKAIKHV